MKSKEEGVRSNEYVMLPQSFASHCWMGSWGNSHIILAIILNFNSLYDKNSLDVQ